MNKTKELQTTTELVKELLEHDQRTRNSDSFLYLKVLEAVADKKDIELQKMPVTYFLTAMNVLGLPAFETVRRTRQKIQHECPWLKAEKNVESVRADNERIFRQYARGSV